MKERKTQIYAIDFDGTIANTKWPEIISPNQPVVDFTKRLQERGDKWILWTNRDGEHLDNAVAWCKNQGVTPDAINDNLQHMKDFFGNNPRKVFANFYIDDHNAGGLFLPWGADTDDDDPHPIMPINHQCCGNCRWMQRPYVREICKHPKRDGEYKCVCPHFVCDLFEQ